MVSFKSLGTFLVISCLLASAQAASTKKPAAKERVKALYVKDGNNGELRFLTSNTQINQLITQKQDMLEQLRPTSTGTGTGSAITPIIINTATVGATGTGTGTGTVTATSPGVTTATGAGAGAGNGGGASNFVPPSPIGDLLPQIIAQAVATRGRPAGAAGNRRRVVNKRRGNRRRNGVRKGNRKNKPQIYVVRPRN